MSNHALMNVRRVQIFFVLTGCDFLQLHFAVFVTSCELLLGWGVQRCQRWSVLSSGHGVRIEDAISFTLLVHAFAGTAGARSGLASGRAVAKLP